MDKNNLDNLRHSCAHLLAHAVKQLYPGALNAIGPAIENGFYQDFDMGEWKISEEDFPKIEAKMREILPTWQKFSFKEVSLADAKKLFKANKYKVEMATEFAKQGKKLQTNDPGDFLDLCKMGHVENPSKELKIFKLLSVAGAYWKGNEKNKMLTRIYGTCFSTQKELDHYLWQLEEAKKRDHRKLGKELKLFVISEDIGKGLPLLAPNGAIIKKEIIAYENELEFANDFEPVSCPHIARTEIYKKTGHWEHYQDTMYAPFGVDDDQYVLKPMNCPHHYAIYQSQKRSYRDLPVRLTEDGTCYRYEKSGELSGLLRVRSLTIDDSHILMREDQVEAEFKMCIEMVAKMFAAFQLNDYYVRLSLADPSDAVKYITDKQTWQKAGQLLEKIIKANNLDYIVAKGEASFYGPKIDYMVKDSIGREWQMSTLQLDLFMAKRLGLVYTDKDGQEKNPVILHRGLTGSIERTLAVLIEHFAGAFPLWLAPIQVAILPVSEKQIDLAKRVAKELKAAKLRSVLDADNKTLSAKIREWTLQKVPYLCIIGNREVEKSQETLYLTVRDRAGKDLGTISIIEFTSKLKQQIEKKT